MSSQPQLSSTMAALLEEIKFSLNSIPNNADPRVIERLKTYHIGFLKGMMTMTNKIKADQTWQQMDFLPISAYEIDIGPVESEQEFDIFNAFRVSSKIPFIVINKGKTKLNKGNYIASDRIFKIFNGSSSDPAIVPLIKAWSTDLDINVPDTMVAKIFMPKSKVKKITKYSFIDMIYVFGKGLFIHLPGHLNKNDAEEITSIIQDHVTDMKVKLSKLRGVSGSFVVDHMIFNKFTLRSILLEKLQFPDAQSGAYDFLLWPFVWFNEKGDKSLSERTQDILNIEVGRLKVRLVLSSRVSKRSDIFYRNGVPVHFKSNVTFNHVSISEVDTMEQAMLVKEIIDTMAYLYVTGNYSNYIASVNHLFIPQSVNLISGNVKNPSFEINTQYIRQEVKKRMELEGETSKNYQNEQLDPTFYGAIATTEFVSNHDRPAEIKVSTKEPGWEQQLWTLMNENPNIQVIRYPLVVEGFTESNDGANMKTIVPPYFVFCSEKNPFFKIKVNPQPYGSDGTYHPYLFLCSSKKYVDTPGETIEAKFQYLANLSYPYTVISQAQRSSSKHVKTTIKVLEPTREGLLPFHLDSVLKVAFRGMKYRSAQGIEMVLNDVSFSRFGVNRDDNTNNLLYALLQDFSTIDDPRVANIKRMFASATNQSEFIQNVVKPEIANSVNLNIGRQELYEFDAKAIRDYFLSPTTVMDSKIFRSILEKFFNTYIFVVEYNNYTMESFIEIPRHKYCYFPTSAIPGMDNVIFLFKHYGAKSFRTTNAQYEIVRLSDLETKQQVPWNHHILRNLFAYQNKTIDINFTTVFRREKGESTFETGTVIRDNAQAKPMLTDVFKLPNIKHQYIDAAGKLRAFRHSFVQDLTIACEPLAPISTQSFDELEPLATSKFFEPQDFKLASEFLKALGIKQQDIQYHMEYESLVAIEEDVPPAIQPEVPKTKAKPRPNIIDIAPENIDLNLIMDFTKQEEESNTEMEKKQRPARKVVMKKNPNAQAIGIWFRIPGVNIQFYIATTPGTPENSSYAINNDPYFQIEPKNAYSRQHDLFERIANILVQIVRNLYIYSRLDDVDAFMQLYTIVDPTVVYNIDKIKRRLTTARDFKSVLENYVGNFKSFFKLVGENTRKRFALVFDSETTRKRIRYHLKIVQRLKEDIIGASGSKIEDVIPDEIGIRRLRFHPFVNSQYYEPTIGINDFMIQNIPRLKEFFNRPTYIIEMFVYASDFANRGPDQNVFMSTGEITEYFDLLDMESTSNVISGQLPTSASLSKSPLYYAADAQSLYIIQNVQGGSLKKVYSILETWDRERVNLGYYAPDTDERPSNYTINSQKIHMLDKSQYLVILEYSSSSYAAMIKLDGLSIAKSQ